MQIELKSMYDLDKTFAYKKLKLFRTNPELVKK